MITPSTLSPQARDLDSVTRVKFPVEITLENPDDLANNTLFLQVMSCC